jgi:meiosis-specific protein
VTFVKYHAVPGSDMVIPIMSLGEDIEKMSLNGDGSHQDPVTQATKEGKTPTLGEVKRSVKVNISSQGAFELLEVMA